MNEVETELAPEAAGGVVKSAGRVLAVLELFHRMRRQLSAAEISQALGYPKSSANALLKSLVALGYLVLNPKTLRYFPSLSVTRLGDWIPSVLLSSGDAFAILREVHAATQETVTLSVQNDLSVIFLKVIPGTFPISLRLTEGFVAPLFTTAVGFAILSQMPDEEIAALAARSDALVRKRSDKVDLQKLLREVRETRQRGFAVRYDALFPDTGAIGVPFTSEVEAFPLAIGVGGLRDRIRRNERSIYAAVRSSLVRHLGRPRRRARPKAEEPSL